MSDPMHELWDVIGPPTPDQDEPMPGRCAHGEDARLCHDEMPAEVKVNVDAAHRHAYDYAVEFLPRNKAEGYAAHVARDVALTEGDLSYIDHRTQLQRWVDKHWD